MPLRHLSVILVHPDQVSKKQLTNLHLACRLSYKKNSIEEKEDHLAGTVFQEHQQDRRELHLDTKVAHGWN